METDQPCFPQTALTYLGNVMNTRAASFYQEHGVQQIAGAYEKERVEDAVLMLSLIHIYEHGLKLISIHDLIVYRLKQESIVEKGVEVNMPTEHLSLIHILSA